MVAIFVAIVLFISNVPGFFGNGPVSITWLLVGFLTFLIPGAIVTGQLGFLFPGEGSIYLWTHKAFGPFASFFAGFAAWWPGVLVMLSTGTVVSQLLQYLAGWTFAPWLQGIVILAVIGLAASVSALRFRLTQNAVNLVFVLYGLGILLVGLAGVLWLATGHKSFTDFSQFDANPGGWFQGMNANPLDFTSSTSTWSLYGLGILLVGLAGVLWLATGHKSFTDFSQFDANPGGWFQGMNANPLDFTSSTSTWSLYGFVILALLGIEVPLNMGVEIVHMKA